MKTIRISDWIAGIALGCTLVFASKCSAQIDMNNLPADILSCEVCRQRLGLPPLIGLPRPMVQPNEVISSSNATPATPLSRANSTLLPAPKSEPDRTLGSPDIMSTSIAEPKAIPIPAAQANEQLELKQVIEQLHRQAKEQAVEHAKMQSEWKKQLEEAEAANRKTLTMLENRSAEVGELKLQLKSQREANSKANAMLEAQSKDTQSDSIKPESKKLERSKGKRKKPAKPS